MRGSLLLVVIVILFVAVFVVTVLLLAINVFRRVPERNVTRLFLGHVLNGGWMGSESAEMRSSPRARGTSTFGEGTHEASCFSKE